MAVAMGTNAAPLQAVGKCSLGAFLTHTLFTGAVGAGDNNQGLWPLNQAVEKDHIHGIPSLFVLVVVPILFVLSVGKLVQTAVISSMHRAPLLIACVVLSVWALPPALEQYR
eukprot:TRINITY_DN54588_c0_g1_i1.p1 TRINITY_DN54588_c0_g1~~TRINITY_DN54588_c0_g1_i1.p1  ORF type:complete len:131 (-),score=6.66 TRINITY_DN54588_c0_g1_i1:37-372(-)